MSGCLLQVGATPDWARQAGLTPPTTGKVKRDRALVEHSQALETPSRRGPVARRLDVESASPFPLGCLLQSLTVKLQLLHSQMQ